MDYLFLEYANTDLRKNPEFLLIISKYLNDHYRNVYNQIVEKAASNQESFKKAVNSGYKIPLIQILAPPTIRSYVKEVLVQYRSLKPFVDSNYPNDFLRRELDRSLDKKNTEKIFAIEGAFFWVVDEDGCNGCRYNGSKGRAKIIEDVPPPCFICDWIAFRELLCGIISEQNLSNNEFFIHILNTYNDFFFQHHFVCKDGHLSQCSLMNFYFDGQEQYNRPQFFSRILMAIIGHSLFQFLMKPKYNKKSPDPKDLIKKCRMPDCRKFFIASRSNATNCPDCIGGEPSTVTAKRQKIRREKIYKRLKSELHRRGKARGLTGTDVRDWLDYWINERKYKIQDISDLPDSTIFPQD